MFFFMIACTPQFPSTTWVMPKSTATDISAIALSAISPFARISKPRIFRKTTLLEAVFAGLAPWELLHALANGQPRWTLAPAKYRVVVEPDDGFQPTSGASSSAATRTPGIRRRRHGAVQRRR